MNRLSVGELLEKLPSSPKIKKSRYCEKGVYPIVDQSQSFIAGYTDDTSWLYTGDLPVVVFGDHTRVLKLVNFPFCIGADGTQILRPKKNIDIRYFYYSLKNIDLSNYGYERHFKYLKESVIELPLFFIQKKIATILSAYDDLIENNLRRIKILEEMAQNLYREWFVNFRFPGHEGTCFVESPLGKIPEGWEVRKLQDVLELKYGKALKKADRLGGDVPVYGSSGVVGYHNNYLVKGPGIIVGRKGNVGSVFWSNEDFYPIDTVYYVSSKLPLRFLYYELQNKNFINNDAAVPGLNRNQAYSLELVVPTEGILSKFCRIADDFERQAYILKKKNISLRQTRDLLLPKLISGKVDVSELDIKVPEEVAV